MIRFALPLALATLITAPAQAESCAPETYQRLADLTAQAREGSVQPEALGQEANAIVARCGDDRVALGQIMAMFTVAGIAIEPPSPVRAQVHLFAFRTANRIANTLAPGFDPVSLADGATWGPADERDAYWDLMFTMSSDYLVYGLHEDIYTPGTMQQVGCNLYPAEEASALATHAEGGADDGEFLPRIDYLATQCDGEDHATSGQAVVYFVNHMKARAAGEGYVGLTGGDIRGGIQRFLPRHLAGRDSSDLFSAEDVAELMAF